MHLVNKFSTLWLPDVGFEKVHNWSMILRARRYYVKIEGRDLRGCIQKFPHWVDNEINNNKHSFRSNTKGYGGKTH
jgi:hypothetical protein